MIQPVKTFKMLIIKADLKKDSIKNEEKKTKMM